MPILAEDIGLRLWLGRCGGCRCRSSGGNPNGNMPLHGADPMRTLDINDQHIISGLGGELQIQLRFPQFVRGKTRLPEELWRRRSLVAIRTAGNGLHGRGALRILGTISLLKLGGIFAWFGSTPRETRLRFARLGSGFRLGGWRWCFFRLSFATQRSGQPSGTSGSWGRGFGMGSETT